MKLAFVHLIRTGGTFLGELFEAATGLPIHCGWRRDLNRDLLRSELFAASLEPAGMIHNHVVNWDAETHRECQRRGWKSFAVVRDPCEQLVSLWHYCGGEESMGSIDEFLLHQARGGSQVNLSHHDWALPDWWATIDVLIPFRADVQEQFCQRLAVPTVAPRPPINVAPRSATPSQSTLAAIRRTVYYDRYLDAMEIVP